MNNLSVSAFQQRKASKHTRPSPLLSTDTSHFTKESKTFEQSRNGTTKTDNLQTNLSSDSSIVLNKSVRFEIENHFDSILRNMKILPIHTAIEPVLTNIYTCYKSILWITKDIRSYSFYSPTLDRYISGEDSLLAAAARAKTSILSPVINCFKASSNEETTEFEKIEAECSKMFFPLYLKSGNVIAVAEIMRTESQDPFDDHDLKISSFLIKKFLIYGSALFNPSETVLFASEFSQISSPNNLYHRLSSSLIRGFNCKIVDFWCHHNNSKDILKLDSEKGEFVQPPKSNIGVVTAAIRNKTNINAKSSRYHPNFSFNADPLPDDPILISTFEVEDCIFATVLRGRKIKSVFSKEEELKLETVMPFISRSLLFSMNMTKKDDQQKDPFEIQLADLLDSAALFATQLTFDGLVKAIQEKSAKLVNAKSCRFILYDHLSNQFVLNDESTNLPGNIGLTGNVASFGSTIRISSPMSDLRFDRKIDLEVHQVKEIDSMLIVPVYSSLEKVVGVLSLVNTKEQFTEEDERIITSIAKLSSISLQNAKIFQSSLNLSQKLNSFVRIKNEKNFNESTLLTILKRVQDESKAYRVTLFLIKEKTSDFTDQSFLLYRSIGGPPEQGTKFSLPAAQQQKAISYPINDDFSERFTTPLSSRIAQNSFQFSAQSNTPKASKTDSMNKKSSNAKVDMGTSPSPNKSGRLICCTPIFNDKDDSNEIIGVLEIGVFSIDTPEEIDLFQSFCNIVVLSIRKQALKEIIQIRNEQFALQEKIREAERDLFDVPSIFKENVPENVFAKEFDITNVDSQYLFNIAFHVFNKLNLMKEFKIPASNLFLFLLRIKNLLNEEQNWRHSIEVACFLSYAIIVTKFNEKIPSHELLSLIIASFCHDIKSTSIPSPSNNSSLDALYSRKSVFESFSCVETFSLLSLPDSNILVNLSEDKINACNELIIQLILATDYYKHYSLLHEFKELISNENINFDNQENRLLVMKILLKCSDVGVIARVHDIADKYQENICDEFFLHGPYDKAREIVFTSPILKDRSHIDKNKSKRTVLDSVFAPMFRLIVKIFPQLNDALNCMSENITKWEHNKLGPDRMFEKE